jgi:hypothetical protein
MAGPERLISWTEDVYLAAFELWAFIHDGNCRAVARSLAADGHPVPARTVRYWADRHNWPNRKLERLGQDLPGLHRLNLAHLAYGSTEGFRRLRQVARGESRDVAPSIVRNEVNAAVMLIDRAGYAPRHIDSGGQHRPNLPAIAQDLELGDEDVAALILGSYTAEPIVITSDISPATGVE